MRAPTTLLRAGLSATAALLLLTACGGSDEESSAAPSSSSSGSSASSSAPAPSSSPAGGSAGSAEAAAFCTQASSLQESINATVGQAGTDPTKLAPALQELADQYAAVDAPQAISADWGTLVDGIQQLATAAKGIDFTDPAAAQQLQASLDGLETQLTDATTHVSAYATTNCPQAAPSS
jgi:hypothetical protein